MVKYDNIPGFPGYYISKRGGLWSNRKNGQWKKLKPHLNKMWNRYQCTLRDSRGIRKLCKISRLVATVYLPNPENLPIVMHLDNNPTIEIGSTWEQALKIALNSEIETIGHYKKIQRAIAQYEERPDYDDVNYFLEKLIADEEHHIKLLKEAMGMDKSTKGVTVIIK